MFDMMSYFLGLQNGRIPYNFPKQAISISHQYFIIRLFGWLRLIRRGKTEYFYTFCLSL